MEKEKKGFKIKRITFIVIIFVMLILAGNVFAALSGKNNLFFAIRDLVVEKEVECKDDILVDRDETDLVEKSESKDDETTELEDKDESLNIVLSKKDEEYAKNIIKTYYKLLSKKEIETVSIFEELDLRVDMTQDLKEYTPENYKEHPENYMWTGIKYSDFNNKMGNYMNDKIMKEKFSEYVEYEEYLYCEENTNWENLEYEVETFELVFVSNDQNECTYDVDVKKGNEFIEETITLGRGNGDFVIKEILNNKGDVKADDFENNEIKEKIFSEEEIKTSLQNYLDLVGTREGSPIGMLVKLELCNYSDYENANKTDDNYIKTNIKYSTYKEKMLEYVTEDWFNTKFKNDYKEQDGILYYFDAGATGMEFEVKDITIKGDYSAQVYIAQVYDIHLDGSKELNNVEFHIANKNGKCVISYCD